MKIVRVIYTTNAQFADTNSRNIRDVVNELRELGHTGIKYSTYLADDGKTFMHFDQFENEAAHQLLVSLPSFKKFDRELLSSGLEQEPRLDVLNLVGSTETFFSGGNGAKIE
ncbi:MAG: hypothetical protein EOO04_14320 [Chitinophagaceae bacterium]|nr:MAG: hypothetical protein EOO04_14320 [Chitinophagaceae bacterium]